MMNFRVIASTEGMPRLGSLSLSGTLGLETPHCLVYSKRGNIPHITHDMASRIIVRSLSHPYTHIWGGA